VWHSRSRPHTGLFYHAHTFVGVAGVLAVVPRKSCHVSLVTLESSGVMRTGVAQGLGAPAGTTYDNARMRALQLSVAVMSVMLPCAAGSLSAAETSAASVVVSARFSSRTTLRVSTSMLRFDVTGANGASASVDFSAGARTRTGAEVLLSVEQAPGIDDQIGEAESVVSFAGEGSGVLGGALHAASPAIAARWFGSGLRQGRLVFALRGAAPGCYMLPVRFVLSAP
jgi:hypothetical protein